MLRMFDYLCEDFHKFERLTDDSQRWIPCSVCGKTSQRIVSAPQIKLEGITGAFPGAYEKWERVRAEKLQQERKRNASHGED